jgi:peptidoglycan/xylan/chitin deacetylase (PgdA/CDA1 family)
VSKKVAPVLTYHSCARRVQPSVTPVDNVIPERLYEQLDKLRKQFHFVNIDELCEARTWHGLAAVTFDDGYKNVVEEALPVFSALDIPFTVFVNNIGFENKIFWRHKVTFIRHSGLQQDLECFLKETRKIRGLDFHEYSKHPDNSSIRVESELDDFLVSRRIPIDYNQLLFDNDSYFISHPLVWYGNHTASHYVLSSLTLEDQCTEIKRTRDFLRTRAVNISKVFALPFGQTYHANRDTLVALQSFGYQYMLMNRNRLNFNRPPACDGITPVERFSVLDAPIWPQLHRALLSNIRQRFINVIGAHVRPRADRGQRH